MTLFEHYPLKWLGDEKRGFIIQVVIIPVLVVVYFLIGFYVTDVGLNVKEGFTDGRAAASIVGIILWAAIVILWLLFMYCGTLDDAYKDDDDLIYVVLTNILYTLFRWPIFFGIAATNIPALIVVGFWVDPIAVVIILSFIGLKELIKRFKKRRKARAKEHKRREKTVDV